jgi:hypothetical protein
MEEQAVAVLRQLEETELQFIQFQVQHKANQVEMEHLIQ